MVASVLPYDENAFFGARTSESTKTETGAKAMLAHARSPAERKRAVATAIKTGLPLHKIEEFMDWVDAMCECDTTTLECTDTLTAACESSERTGKADFTLVLQNDQSQIPPVVEFLASRAAQVGAVDSMEQMRIGLALEEALVNALYHGNLEIDSDSTGTEQMCRHDLAQCRLGQQPFCDRRIRVVAILARNAAVFIIRDEGRGFDPSRLPDPTDEANLGRCCGRGVFLMRSLMDQVTFNAIGNEVTMVRRWTRN